MSSTAAAFVHVSFGPKGALGTRRRETARPAHASDDRSPVGLADVRVLIVESDAASAESLRAALDAEGCDTRATRTAEAAFVVLATFVPQVIVLDLVLPLMSGLVFVQRLKAADATRDIELIAMSVIDGVETETLALSTGCAAYLRRPIDAPSLTRLIQLLLGEGR